MDEYGAKLPRSVVIRASLGRITNMHRGQISGTGGAFTHIFTSAAVLFGIERTDQGHREA